MSYEQDFIEQQQRYIQLKDKELEQEKITRLALQNDNMRSGSFPTEQTKNLVEYQLDLKEDLNHLFHLLSGHELGIDSLGNESWIEPKDQRMKILSEYGVKQIMNIVRFHINRNTLLSKYNIEEVNDKLRDFAETLISLVFNRQELFFDYPSPEELFDKCKKIADENNIRYRDDELYEKCLEWSQEELDNKFAHFKMLCLCLIDAVENTYHRAVDGLERKSLREHTQISQMANTSMSAELPRVKRGGIFS
jgi:hypothetical protein